MDLSEKLTLKQKCKEGEGVSQINNWVIAFQAKGTIMINSKVKQYLVFSKTAKKSYIRLAQKARGREVRRKSEFGGASREESTWVF